MKEDILEQAVDDWFLSQPSTFTKHNIKFKPSHHHVDFNSRQDSNVSDIDVLAVCLDKFGSERVSAVSCKSWQAGFDPLYIHKTLLTNPEEQFGGREIWKSFRELISPKWGEAFSNKIYEETLSKDYTYYILVTKFIIQKSSTLEIAKKKFENCSTFRNNLKYDNSSKIKIKLFTFKELFYQHFIQRHSTTLEATELGRLIQIFRASDIKIENEQ